MLRRPLIVGIFLLAVAGTVETSWAQPPQGGRRPGGFGFGGPGGGPGGISDGMLLGNEQVKKELELTAEQTADLDKLREAQQEKMRETFGGLRDLSEEERRAKFDELRPKMEEAQKENREKINGILLPHQQERLKQISLQLRGFGAIEDADVASELKISDEQKQKIATAREGQREKMQAMFRDGGGGGDRDAMREKFQTLRKENEEELLGILTSEQREQFEKMKGEKFEMDMSQFGRGGPGGPGGGRFGGRRPDGDRPEGNRRPTNDEANKDT